MVTQVKNVEVLGLKELEKFMKDELPDVFERRLETLKALRDSSESMLAGAKSNTDKFRKSGALGMSLGFKSMTKSATLRSKGDTYAAIFLAPLNKMEAYQTYVSYYNRGSVDEWLGDHRIRHGHLLEFGFRHPSGQHIPGQHWLRNAFDTYSGDVIRNFRHFARDRVKKAARRNFLKQARKSGML